MQRNSPPNESSPAGAHAPTPAAVRLLAVPDPAPPYDDAPLGESEPVPTEYCGERSDGPADDSDTERRAAADGPPPAQGWPSQFAQVLAETLAGSRPPQQLIPWTTEQARRRIRQLTPTLATDQRPRVRRIMTSAPSQDVLEMTAVVGFGPRVRVLALRLERTEQGQARQADSQWRCTVIESA